MKNKSQTVGERLKTLREHYKAKGLTAKMIAETVNISPMQLNNMEADRVKSHNYETISLIAEYLGSTADWILSGEGKMLPDGEVDFRKRSVSASNKNLYYRDELVAELKQEAAEWKAEYQWIKQLLNDLRNGATLGKLRRVKGTALQTGTSGWS